MLFFIFPHDFDEEKSGFHVTQIHKADHKIV